MITKVKLLLGISDNYQNELLEVLIDNAKSFAVSYCRLNEYNSNLDSAVTRMVIEDYNRMGGEGTDNQTFSGMSESYADDYSEQTYKLLNRFRKIKLI